MRSFNHIILSFLLTVCLAGGAATASQTPKKDREKSAKNAQSFNKTTSKKDAKTPPENEENAEAVAKNSKPKTETNAKPKAEPAASEKAPTEDEKAAFETA